MGYSLCLFSKLGSPKTVVGLSGDRAESVNNLLPSLSFRVGTWDPSLLGEPTVC